ncbi:MAG TPA: hypothetical protein VKB69_06955 [Micromonosporaceae bacterium]|nr:hypothetical protein [Micromonosporaceae bacterium]
MNTRHLAILVAASFAFAGCASKAPDAAPPGPATTAAPSVTTPPASPVVTGAAVSDWCALVQKLTNQSGLMVGTHFISPLKETLDQLKVAATLYLANADALNDPRLPPNVRAALQVQGVYFQALIDHNFATDTPAPAGLKEAGDTVGAYEVKMCGFVFDK